MDDETRYYEALADNFDSSVEQWHNSSENGIPLHEHLGMSWDEYGLWVTDPLRYYKEFMPFTKDEEE